MTTRQLATLVARAALILALVATLLVPFIGDDQAEAQVPPAGPPTTSNTECDWTDGPNTNYDALGDLTSVAFDVREFVGVTDTAGNAITPGGGPAVGNFTYLVNLDNTADPFNPDADLHPITDSMESNAPIVAAGTDLGDGTESFMVPVGCRYLVSVRADGYKLGSLHIRIESDGAIMSSDGTASPLFVEMVSDQVAYDPDTNQPEAVTAHNAAGLPLAQIEVVAFHDYASINAQRDNPEEEVGLEGFHVEIDDGSGQVAVDWFGDPLCGGDCITDSTGTVLIENLPAGQYDVNVIPPLGTNWVQTLTIEGSHNIEAFAPENFNGKTADGQFLTNPNQLSSFSFGFVSEDIQPDPVKAAADDYKYPYTPDAGGGDITGAIFNRLVYPPLENPTIQNGVDNAPGISEPIAFGYIGLTDIGVHDTQVGITRADADGNFAFADVPPGTYQLSFWDYGLNYIIDFRTVVVAAGVDSPMGDIGVDRWFGWVSGYVFYDDGFAANGTEILGLAVDGSSRAANGVRDCLGDTSDLFGTPSLTFEYWAADGLVDPALCEVGLLGVEVLIRNRDGSVAQGTTTDATGRYELPRALGPNVKAQVLEVGAGQLDYTGHSTHDEFDLDTRYTQGSCPGALCQPADAGGGLLLSSIIIESKRSEVDFGKLSYLHPDAPAGFALGVGNGGIAGAVVYATTRNEFPAAIQAFEDYEPGMPNVPLILSEYIENPGAGCPVVEELVSVDEVPAACLTVVDDTVSTDKYFQPTDCDLRTSDGSPLGNPNLSFVEDRCIEVPQLSNEVKDGAWDGGFAFGDLPTGYYVIEVDTPEFYQVVKENDLNVIEGVNLAPLAPPPPCVGPLHLPQVPDDYGSPFDAFLDGGSGTYTGVDPVALCNKRLFDVRPNVNNGVEIYLMPTDRPFIPKTDTTTDPYDDPAQSWSSDQVVPIPGRLFGLVEDGLTLDVDPNSITYGEPRGVANIPIGVYDFTGRAVTTIWTDKNGFYEVLLPSTQIADAPIPGGVSPNVYTLVVNDPGGGAAPNYGYNGSFLTEPWNLPLWPGKMTKADTPSLSQAVVVCGLPTDSPYLMTTSAVTGDAVLGNTLTLSGTAFENPGKGDAPVVTMTDALGGETILTVSTFRPSNEDILPPTDAAFQIHDEVDVLIPGPITPGIYQIDVSATGGSSPRNGIAYHALGGVYSPPVVTVSPNPSDTTDPVIQTAINAAAAGSLIVIEPGSYRESVVVDRGVMLQGYGPGGGVGTGSLLEAAIPATDDGPFSHLQGSVVEVRHFGFDPAAQTAWTNLVGGLTWDGNQNVEGGAGFTMLLEAGESALDPVRIDGFGITGGRGAAAGGIWANGHADDAVISNNVIEGNSAQRGGGAISLGVHSLNYVGAGDGTDNQNWNVTIRDNRLLSNGGVFYAGGVAIFNDSDNYNINNNDICGNYAAEYGGGISHFGNSPGGVIADNAIYFNNAFDEGGGLLVGGETGTAVLGSGSGDVRIERNIIQSNLSNDDGGGIMVLVALNDAVDIVNNFIVNNLAADAGGGITLDNSANVSLVNNTIAENITTSSAEDSDYVSCGGVSCPRGAGLTSSPHSATDPWTVDDGSTYSDPEMFNNIFWQNRSYSWSETLIIDPEDPEGATNLVFQGFIDMEVVDDVAAQPEVSGALHPTDSLLTVEYPGAGLTDPTNEVGMDPLFVDSFFRAPTSIQPRQGGFGGMLMVDLSRPEASILGLSDYHITGASPAIDHGVPLGAPVDDIDRDTRDALPDAGADEQAVGGPLPVVAYFSIDADDGVYADEDILTWDSASVGVFFDASAAGVPTTANLAGFDVIDADTFLLTFDGAVTLPAPAGAVDARDVVLYDAGAWSLAVDGSTAIPVAPLDTPADYDIEALHLEPDGSLLVSFAGHVHVSNGAVLLNRDEADVMRLIPTAGDLLTGPAVTAASFAQVFDGSDVGLLLPEGSINAVAHDPTAVALFLSTLDDAMINASGADAGTVSRCGGFAPSASSTCTRTEFISAPGMGLSTAGIDGVALP